MKHRSWSVVFALLAGLGLTQAARANAHVASTRIDLGWGSSSRLVAQSVLIDCENLNDPGPTEFRLCVTQPTPPGSSGPSCDTQGNCSCTGAADCMLLGQCKRCDTCTCNPTGCTCEDCSDAGSKDPECDF